MPRAWTGTRRYLLARFPWLRHVADVVVSFRRHVRLAAGPLSVWRLSRLERLAESPGPTLTSSSVRLRPLGGKRVRLRAHTSDYYVVTDTFCGLYHLPPSSLAPRTVFDLGANIGLTIAHYAALFPGAKIVGVELDAGNFAVCQENISSYGERCMAVCGAVWPTDGEVAYRRRRGNELGFAVGASDEGDEVVVHTVTIDSLFARTGWETVDFVKMDIEGAERVVLADAGEWVTKVGCISVEVHPPYTVGECEQVLRSVGFQTIRHPRHWSAVIGCRTSSTGQGDAPSITRGTARR